MFIDEATAKKLKDMPTENTSAQLLEEPETAEKSKDKRYTKFPEKFYNGKYLWNSDKAFNFCLGNRSSGKSVFWLMGLMLKSVCDGEQFVYLRRYKSDLEDLGNKLFADAQNTLKFYHPDVLFDLYGIKNRDIEKYQQLSSMSIQIQLKDTTKLPQGLWLIPDEFLTVSKTEWENYYVGTNIQLGYTLGLSQVEKYKPMSGMFNKIQYIFLDEFLSESGDYLKPYDRSFEPTQCFNLYQTIARGDGNAYRDGVKFIFCANCIQLFNPYFMFLGLTKQIKNNANDSTGNCKLKTEGLALEIINKERNEVYESSFGKLIAGTAYDNQMQNNDWLTGIPSYFITENVSYDSSNPIAVTKGIGVFAKVNNLNDKPFGRTTTFYFAKSKAKGDSTPYDIASIIPYIKVAWSLYRLRFDSLETYNTVANEFKL